MIVEAYELYGKYDEAIDNQEAYEYYVKGRTNLERLTIAIGDREAICVALAETGLLLRVQFEL
jgi:hypothetical protein